MKISVALATFNGEKYIKEQLQSILSQQLPVDEVVISDDGSSDSTPEIIKDFIKDNELENWSFSVNEKNLGYAQNFIHTIKKTTGDIVFLCDQDADLWMIHTDIDLIDGQGTVIANHYEKLKEGLHILGFDEFARRLNYCGMASAFKSELRDAIDKYDLSEIPTHDWILSAIACIEGGFATRDLVLTYRRKHENNAELRQKVEKATREDRIEYIKKYNLFYTSLVNILSANGKKNNEYITWLRKRIDLNAKRIKFLEERDIIPFIMLIREIDSFPSKQSFGSEIRYYFR